MFKMSIEVSGIPNALPLVSEHTFTSVLLAYQHDPEQLHEQMTADVDGTIVNFSYLAEIAVENCDVDDQLAFTANDQMYIMAGLLTRQFVSDYYATQFSIEIGLHDSSAIILPEDIESQRDIENEERSLPVFMELNYDGDNRALYKSVPVLEIKGLIERRSNDAIQHFFSGDYFMEDLHPRDRLAIGTAAIRLYGLLNHIAANS